MVIVLHQMEKTKHKDLEKTTKKVHIYFGYWIKTGVSFNL
jgi:hypothetical protein